MPCLPFKLMSFAFAILMTQSLFGATLTESDSVVTTVTGIEEHLVGDFDQNGSLDRLYSFGTSANIVYDDGTILELYGSDQQMYGFVTVAGYIAFIWNGNTKILAPSSTKYSEVHFGANQISASSTSTFITRANSPSKILLISTGGSLSLAAFDSTYDSASLSNVGKLDFYTDVFDEENPTLTLEGLNADDSLGRVAAFDFTVGKIAFSSGAIVYLWDMDTSDTSISSIDLMIAIPNKPGAIALTNNNQVVVGDGSSSVDLLYGFDASATGIKAISDNIFTLSGYEGVRSVDDIDGDGLDEIVGGRSAGLTGEQTIFSGNDLSGTHTSASSKILNVVQGSSGSVGGGIVYTGTDSKKYLLSRGTNKVVDTPMGYPLDATLDAANFSVVTPAQIISGQTAELQYVYNGSVTGLNSSTSSLSTADFSSVYSFNSTDLSGYEESGSSNVLSIAFTVPSIADSQNMVLAPRLAATGMSSVALSDQSVSLLGSSDVPAPSVSASANASLTGYAGSIVDFTVSATDSNSLSVTFAASTSGSGTLSEVSSGVYRLVRGSAVGTETVTFSGNNGYAVGTATASVVTEATPVADVVTDVAIVGGDLAVSDNVTAGYALIGTLSVTQGSNITASSSATTSNGTTIETVVTQSGDMYILSGQIPADEPAGTVTGSMVLSNTVGSVDFPFSTDIIAATTGDNDSGDDAGDSTGDDSSDDVATGVESIAFSFDASQFNAGSDITGTYSISGNQDATVGFSSSNGESVSYASGVFILPAGSEAGDVSVVMTAFSGDGRDTLFVSSSVSVVVPVSGDTSTGDDSSDDDSSSGDSSGDSGSNTSNLPSTDSLGVETSAAERLSYLSSVADESASETQSSLLGAYESFLETAGSDLATSSVGTSRFDTKVVLEGDSLTSSDSSFPFSVSGLPAGKAMLATLDASSGIAQPTGVQGKVWSLKTESGNGATVSLPASSVSATSVKLQKFNESTELWEDTGLPVTLDGDSYTVTLVSNSMYALVEDTSVSTPTSSGSGGGGGGGCLLR